MAVSMLLLRHREEFATFGGYVNSPSFAALLYQQLCELRRFSIGPEELREVDSPRVRDVALMLEAYQKDILSRYTDVVGRMEMMVERIPEAPMLRGSHVFIDGFEMVTDQLLRVVGAIMGTAEEVAVTFRLGQENDRDFPIFETELSHYKRIEKLALSAGKRLHPVPSSGRPPMAGRRPPPPPGTSPTWYGRRDSGTGTSSCSYVTPAYRAFCGRSLRPTASPAFWMRSAR